MKRSLQHEASMLYSSAHAVPCRRAEEHQVQPAKAGAPRRGSCART
jgi:hypothetical protein